MIRPHPRGAAPGAIAIGASAGAVSALSVLLPGLTAPYGLPVLVVVHVPAGRHHALASLFAARCRLPVREVDDKQPIEPGAIHFAPAGYHLLVEGDGRFALSCDAPVCYARPSIDVLFTSAADAYGAKLVALVLTGANHDGADGLKAVAAAGGRTIVQEPSEAYAQAMPRAALAAVPGTEVMGLAEIAQTLLRLGRG